MVEMPGLEPSKDPAQSASPGGYSEAACMFQVLCFGAFGHGAPKAHATQTQYSCGFDLGSFDEATR